MRQVRDPVDFVVALCTTAFIVMFAAYSYVDISWEARNTIFLAFALAYVGSPMQRRALEPPTSVAGRRESTDDPETISDDADSLVTT